jgi:hypothetical protein
MPKVKNSTSKKSTAPKAKKSTPKKEVVDTPPVETPPVVSTPVETTTEVNNTSNNVKVAPNLLDYGAEFTAMEEHLTPSKRKLLVKRKLLTVR